MPPFDPSNYTSYLQFVWFNYTTSSMSAPLARTVVTNLVGENAQCDMPQVSAPLKHRRRRDLLQVDETDYPWVVVLVNCTSATNWEALNAQYAATSATLAQVHAAGAPYATAAEAYVEWWEKDADPEPSAVAGVSSASSFDAMVYIMLAVAMGVLAHTAAVVTGDVTARNRKN
jgi:hypothetical protein